ncbi:uncharacterized protein [Palaemon carinicauda]|uniref:uncharacterized protein n=1 Tax=Palaemon carinicauda TaxID=392227 RepID=UPI0035B64539
MPHGLHLRGHPLLHMFVDNILVFSSSKEEHLHHLCTVLVRLQQNGVVVLYNKSIAGTVAPLFASLKDNPNDLKWGPLLEAAFCKAKYALFITADLTLPMPPVPLLLSTDASDIDFGLVLEQVVNG